jgi:hypothetical protein
LPTGDGQVWPFVRADQEFCPEWVDRHLATHGARYERKLDADGKPQLLHFKGMTLRLERSGSKHAAHGAILNLGDTGVLKKVGDAPAGRGAFWKIAGDSEPEHVTAEVEASDGIARPIRVRLPHFKRQRVLAINRAAAQRLLAASRTLSKSVSCGLTVRCRSRLLLSSGGRRDCKRAYEYAAG